MVEKVEKIEREGSLWMLERSREPRVPYELNAVSRMSRATAECNIDNMSAADINYCEIFIPPVWHGAGPAFVSKM